MQSIFPGRIFDYMNHIVCFKKTGKLDSICIACCICSITTQIEGHNATVSSAEFVWYCFVV